MKPPTQEDAVIGRFEIGQIFGVSRQGVASIIDHPDFPAPICRQGKHKAPLFWRRDVERFKGDRDRAAAADVAAA
jgi:hypothetical protein